MANNVSHFCRATHVSALQIFSPGNDNKLFIAGPRSVVIGIIIG